MNWVPGERLELGAEALADDAVEDNVDGRVHDEEEVRGAQHHVERHGDVKPARKEGILSFTQPSVRCLIFPLLRHRLFEFSPVFESGEQSLHTMTRGCFGVCTAKGS